MRLRCMLQHAHLCMFVKTVRQYRFYSTSSDALPSVSENCWTKNIADSLTSIFLQIIGGICMYAHLLKISGALEHLEPIHFISMIRYG